MNPNEKVKKVRMTPDRKKIQDLEVLLSNEKEKNAIEQSELVAKILKRDEKIAEFENLRIALSGFLDISSLVKDELEGEDFITNGELRETVQDEVDDKIRNLSISIE